MAVHDRAEATVGTRLWRKAKSLRKYVSSWMDLVLRENVPRDLNPYATHLPVLVGLAHLIQVSRVIEFGGGAYSTGLFLERTIFSQVTRLNTYETNSEWARKIAEVADGDPRFHLHLVEGEMWESVSGALREPCSLIFIDDSDDAQSRSRTIDAVVRSNPRDTVVVIHDFDVEEYRRAARFENQIRVRCINPNVGILWNGRGPSRKMLSHLIDNIRTGVGETSVTDIATWKQIVAR